MTPVHQRSDKQDSKEINPLRARSLLDELGYAINIERQQNRQLRIGCRKDCREHLDPVSLRLESARRLMLASSPALKLLCSFSPEE
jgi:hypothetical protein